MPAECLRQHHLAPSCDGRPRRADPGSAAYSAGTVRTEAFGAAAQCMLLFFTICSSSDRVSISSGSSNVVSVGHIACMHLSK